MIKIQSGIPIPTTKAGYLVKVFEKMKIGDCFDIHETSRGSVWTSLNGFNKKKNIKYKLTTRKIENDMVRVWRLK